MERPQVLVVGAGVAGLACARELARRGVPAVVLERARGVGGRCATRRVNGQPVDFGLPFLPARSGEFAEALNELDAGGKIPGWPVRVRDV
ncbi:MAG: FAD-dependent oxidoreductase, partial [Candidatus Eisenbacteria bacterium]|nr:FAD-dependent oxidoreductase [Candidatus Eisenbacteria bacterium]